MAGPFAQVYAAILMKPRWVLALVACVCVVAGVYVPRFSFDASADTLVVEGDPALEYYRQVAARFGGDEFLVLTYTPTDAALFDPEVLQRIRRLHDDLAVLDGVSTVYSILDAPLLRNDHAGANSIPDDYVTLLEPGTDLDRAREELVDSPLFGGYLISADARTTALRIDLAPAVELDALLAERDRLRALMTPSTAQAAHLTEVETRHARARDDYLEQRGQLISTIRDIRGRYSDSARLYLGGVPMIAADMIDYVKHDMLVFGVTVLVIVTLMLYFFFRRLRWVVLPVATSMIAAFVTAGWLGFVQRPVTVVSANFIAVLAIVTISLTIHLIVRYREILRATPEIDHAAHVAETMRSKFAPCFYTALTTIVAFGSLLTSRIVPVADFGWMMCLGVVFAFAVTYSFFPAMLLVIGKGTPSKTLGKPLRVVNAALGAAQRRSGVVMIVAVVTFAVAVFGITRLTLNDRFVDYFDAHSDIHAGMRFIDAELGGTAPLDVIVSVSPYEAPLLDPEDDFATDEDDAFPERYWFTPDKLALIDQLHGFIEDHAAVGKVISIATLDRIGRTFNGEKHLDALQIVAAISAFPESMRNELIAPYASPSTGELRISARIIESGPTFSRNQLLLDIHQFAEQELGLEASDVRVTGMFVLFNDMLTQLLSSQTSTLLYVLIATFVMFTVLLRSPVLGLIGMVPNILAAAWVLGIMGLAGIPLDMMTITIAAITIGIGVDNTIHYLYRYREEYRQTQEVAEAARRAGASIGRAMYFTSMTITAGFSVLAFSNFMPTVHFGLLAALAMILAIAADLTVLPSLLIQSLGRLRPSAGP